LSATDLFVTTYGRAPDGLWSAPGRVNLIGEHTDYNNGLVLPFAIDARAQVAAARIDEPVLRIVSAQRRGAVVEAPMSVLSPGSAATRGWPAYLFGPIWALAEAGIDLPGAEVALDSQVPAGAGLSSSAAVECATALAMSALAEVTLGRADLARLCQHAENAFVGVPSGLMDQMASATCRAGNLLFFDVGAQTTEHIPFDPAARGLRLLVIDTQAHHSLADGEYAKRRASCEQAAAILGLDSLRDIENADAALAVLATAASVPRADRDVLVRRVRHILTENARVQHVVDRLRNGGSGEGDIGSIGDILTESHLSMRDDYEISCAELDAAVDAALGAGAFGARMTGGGFGGSVIALVSADSAGSVTRDVQNAFAAAGFTAPVVRSVTPAEGARQDR
jgi:galactokinase